MSRAQPFDQKNYSLSCTEILDVDISRNEATATSIGGLILHISNCEFSYNREASLTATFLQAYTSTIRNLDIVLIEHCRYVKNSAIEPAIWLLDYRTNAHSEIVIADTFLSSNWNTTALSQFDIIYVDLDLIATKVATIKLESVQNVTFRNCIFVENKVSAISTQNSHIFFEGVNHFANNLAFHGGAIFLSSSSVMLLRRGTRLYFTNNHALRKGGAISILLKEITMNVSFMNVTFKCMIQLFIPCLNLGFTYFSQITQQVRQVMQYMEVKLIHARLWLPQVSWYTMQL